MRTVTQNWRDICSMLKNFEELSGSSQDLYLAFCKWLRENRNHFDKKTWNAYGFDKYINLNPSLYVAEFTEGTVQDNVERFARYKPNSIDTLAMFIRDILWDIIVFKTNIECARCGDDHFRALANPETNEIFLSCDRCTWTQSMSGVRRCGPKILIPARKNLLMDFMNNNGTSS